MPPPIFEGIHLPDTLTMTLFTGGASLAWIAWGMYIMSERRSVRIAAFGLGSAGILAVAASIIRNVQ